MSLLQNIINLFTLKTNLHVKLIYKWINNMIWFYWFNKLYFNFYNKQYNSSDFWS